MAGYGSFPTALPAPALLADVGGGEVVGEYQRGMLLGDFTYLHWADSSVQILLHHTAASFVKERYPTGSPQPITVYLEDEVLDGTLEYTGASGNSHYATFVDDSTPRATLNGEAPLTYISGGTIYRVIETGWYEHDELVAQANGAKQQPPFDPAASTDPQYEDGVLERHAKQDALMSRVNEISALIRSLPKHDEVQ